jgi:hypothetical protein
MSWWICGLCLALAPSLSRSVPGAESDTSRPAAITTQAVRTNIETEGSAPPPVKNSSPNPFEAAERAVKSGASAPGRNPFELDQEPSGDAPPKPELNPFERERQRQSRPLATPGRDLQTHDLFLIAYARTVERTTPGSKTNRRDSPTRGSPPADAIFVRQEAKERGQIEACLPVVAGPFKLSVQLESSAFQKLNGLEGQTINHATEILGTNQVTAWLKWCDAEVAHQLASPSDLHLLKTKALRDIYFFTSEQAAENRITSWWGARRIECRPPRTLPSD